MFRATCVFFTEFKRFNGFKPNTNVFRHSKETRQHIVAGIRNREAAILKSHAEKREARGHNERNMQYSSTLRNAVAAMEGSGGRSPEKLAAMRDMLTLSEAAKAEGRKHRTFTRYHSKHR